MRSFFTDMKRVFKSWGFWACAAGMVIALLICAASSIMNIGRPGNVVLPGAYEAILENALSSDIVLMAVPILCAIVYAASFVKDVASGFIKLLMSIMLIVNIRKGQFFGVISVLALSLYGFLLNPQTFNTFLRLPEHYMYIANVLTGWASPLQQASNVTHDFESGKIHGIIGNNGSGKTVLFRCICGFIRPSSGQILVYNEEVGKSSDFPDELGIIIESPGFLLQYSGFKNLEILASLKAKIQPKEIQEAMRRVGLDPAQKKPVGKYSLGMRQRLGIAQAIMEQPKLLILDESLNGLDKKGVADMRLLFKELRGEGATILMASHNAADIDELCDTVCEMDAGVLKSCR